MDWWEWGPEAFAEAKRRDAPVLLSVGYAACHWCHVMAHESFEDDGVAAAVNGRFVAVKVDREERPDVDAVYMAATTALTGHGGWPMTCLLTPDGDPFFAGTYLPKEQLLALLDQASALWDTDRERVVGSGASVAARLRDVTAPPPPSSVDAAVCDAAARRLRRDHDDARGGFGGAPKFPPSMVLEFLLRHHARTGSPDALAMVRTTCAAMARGGMYDQLGGGFARYAVDAAWVVPHFEKMLYDNSLLLRVHAHLFRATADPFARRVVEETAEFLLRDLRTDEGAFASALDADTVVDGHSHEGLTYSWTPAQLTEVLGPEDGDRAARLLSVTDAGTFEAGSSTLQLRQDPDDPAWWAITRARLLAARDARPQPSRDDKVVTAWNGLAVAGLAEAGALLGRPALVDAARAAADVLLATHLVDGTLRRTSRRGVVSAAPAVLEDHGDLAEGLLALHQATGEPRWAHAAEMLLDAALDRFVDDDGTPHDTAHDAPGLFARPAARSDGAEPAGASSLAGALLTLSALTGSTRHRDAALAALDACGSVAAAEPRFAGWSLAVAEAVVAGPLQVAVVGAGPGADALAHTARGATSPGLVVLHGMPDAAGLPLLADRPLVDGSPAAYVCRGFVCERPVTSPGDLREALDRRPAPGAA